MIARSNSSYELIVRSATDLVLKESETLRVGIGSVDAVAGRMHLMPDATSVLVTPGELAGPRDQIVVARGPRISRGGNDWTTDNAIRLTIEVQLPREVPEAELVVTMQFMGQ